MSIEIMTCEKTSLRLPESHKCCGKLGITGRPKSSLHLSGINRLTSCVEDEMAQCRSIWQVKTLIACPAHPLAMRYPS